MVSRQPSAHGVPRRSSSSDNEQWEVWGVWTGRVGANQKQFGPPKASLTGPVWTSAQISGGTGRWIYRGALNPQHQSEVTER